MKLDPTPLITTDDPDYVLAYKIVTDLAIEEWNRVHG